MSTVQETLYDVFLSHGVHDTGIAEIVRKRLEASDLGVFAMDHIDAGIDLDLAVRSALAESSAVILILTRSTVGSPYIAFEVGAAMAWNKPIYVLYDGLANDDIPSYLRQFHVVGLGEAERIVNEIAKAKEPMSDAAKESLINIYEELGIPTDQLLRSPARVRDLSESFRERTESPVESERLLRELLRLRKQGKLPKIGRS